MKKPAMLLLALLTFAVIAIVVVNTCPAVENYLHALTGWN